MTRVSSEGTPPQGLLEAFWAYETALGVNDLDALQALFEPGEHTLRGDAAGLLVGREQIDAFRRGRGGAADRGIVEVHVLAEGENAAVVVGENAPASGGRGLQTQAWSRRPEGWRIRAAHVSAPPTTFDRSVWRAVGDPLVRGRGTGPLVGDTVAVKDLFAVRGYAIGAGVPAFEAGAREEPEHADAVAALLHAGADLRGIARTDQFAYSLGGDNEHSGTPHNAVVAGALPGGSSSGSATAVALGAASIGLGTDTAGSIRVPASYQGLWGLRTTLGAVSRRGLLPLAPDFDAVGLLARSHAGLLRAADVLLADARLPAPAAGGLVHSPALVGHLAAEMSTAVGSVARACSATEVVLPDPAELAEAFRIRQAWQAWQQHGDWLTAHPGALTGGARARFEGAAAVTPADNTAAGRALAAARAQLEDALQDDILVLPAASSTAPRLWESAASQDAGRAATIQLTCLASITGRPAVVMPWLQLPAGPLGLCLVGPGGSDLALLRRAGELQGALHGRPQPRGPADDEVSR